VALILNDEALETEDKEFRRYFEKVVDASLKFEPSAEECARIAIDPSSDAAKLLAESCTKLGISNMRLIKRIERSVRQVSPLLARFDDQVLKNAVKTLALLGWCAFDPDNAPSLAFLRKKGYADVLGPSKAKVSEREAAWNALLGDYGFTNMDEFDNVLLNGVQNGFFNSTPLIALASELDKQFKANKLNSTCSDAWELYHGSFENNEEEVLTAIYEASVRNIESLGIGTLSGTVSLLRDLGRTKQASELIQLCLESRGNEREDFNISNLNITGEPLNQEVLSAFNAKYASLADHRDPKRLLLSIQTSWNPKDIDTLAAMPVDDYYEVLKNTNGKELRAILKAIFQFDSIGNASHSMKEIPNKARIALKRIGQESAINAHRVRRYGIEVESDAPERD